MGGKEKWGAAAACLLACTAAAAQVPARPPLLEERLVPNPGYGQEQGQLLWPRALKELGIADAAPSSEAQFGGNTCAYSTALETLRGLRREFGHTAAYVKTWARNQDRVFSACDHRKSGAAAPENPSGANLPGRSASDFDYQLASFRFYQRDYEAALRGFESVRAARAAPQRANAAYMVVRSLAYLKRLDEAYAAIDRIQADPTLREVHAIAANYRFVIMSNSNFITQVDEGRVSPDLALRHLKWLHDVARSDVDRAADPRQALADAKDAREQLAIYFPYHDAEGKVDWWLGEDEPSSARMQAVKTLAPKLPLIDWMAANWATNIFDNDWLWALHDAGNPYWKGNANIVAHAWARWEKERDGAWLQVAIQRVHPSDPLAPQILSAAQAHLAHPWARPPQEESPEYAAWVYTLWDNAVRLHLGRGETKEATALLLRGNDILYVVAPARLPLFARPTDPLFTAERAIRWLVYRGDAAAARAMLASLGPRYAQALKKWRSLLATTAREAHAAGAAETPLSSIGAVGNDPAAWERMLDDLSSAALARMATETAIDPRYRALFARTALARALILGYDNAVVDRYAALAGQMNPAMREQVLAAAAGHSRGDYVSLMLRNPRLRPAVMAEYAKETLAADAIDPYNHNDNNWWCAYDRKALRERAFNAWRIVPQPGRLFTGKEMEAELVPYLSKQRALLDAHPYRALADDKEAAALEKIPSGPRFLSEAAVAREGAIAAIAAAERNARAADLHRAVRTTRYGCGRDGSHADYSRAAHKLLHARYEDTPWAKATPYWFK